MPEAYLLAQNRHGWHEAFCAVLYISAKITVKLAYHMNNFFYLDTCSTCKRIMKALSLSENVSLREIKSKPLNAEEVDRLAAKIGSYEAIFSRRAMKFRALGLHEKELTEKDYRHYLLEDYTFLKRPVLEAGSQVVAGNSKASVAQMQTALQSM